MLKFQFTQSNNSYDTKTLEIADVERKEGVVYDISGNDYDTISELDNEVQYSISVKNLYGIQNGSYINYVGNVTVGTDDDGTKTSYRYVKELIVDSVSSIENSFNVNVEKELPLYVENVRIESTYHTISFNNNRWEVNLSSKEMVDEAKRRLERSKLNLKNDDNYPIYNEINEININQFAFGENGITEGVETEYDKIDNTVFYYENDSWKTIDLVGNDLEECLINGQFISLESIHEYDKRVCEAIKLDRNNLYYMHENYVVIELSSTHYFIDPQIEYDIIELEYKGGYTMPKMTAYGRNVIKKINYPYVYMYIESLQKENSSLNEIKIEKECHIDGNEKLIFNYDIFKEIVDDGETEENEYPKVIEIDETKRYLTEDELKLFEQYLFPYGYSVDDNGDAETTRGSSGAIKIKRKNFMFDTTYSSFSLTYDTFINVVQIPISQKFENDLFHNDMVQTHFVDAEKNKSINPIVDMEKDMYTPAIQKVNGSQINADYEDCYKIIFNLHFREHRDVTNTDGTKEEWKCDRDSYWNGTRVTYKDMTEKKGTIVDLRGRVYNYPINGSKKTESAKKDYFSYFGSVPENTTPSDDVNDIYGYDGEGDYDTSNERYYKLREKRNALTEYQSDLLSYLGFVNNDVKYQKSKLTKSFLRLSFYDSDNIGNQNLLQTSTIFLDGGELFAKYIKYINTEEEYIASNKNIYTKTEYDLLTDDKKSNLGFTNNGEPTANIGDSTVSGDKNTSYNNSGVRVSREPMRKSAINIKNGDLGDNIDELERLRLSSQIAITDKFSSKHSSEGFYFYTYKTNNNGVYPSDIYMRVDFCHAGYGRTLPFMMPYIRNNEQENIERYVDRSNKIKTFDDIAYDWSAVDIDKDGMPLKDDSDVGYDPIKYMKYCYIKLKYRYDKKTQKHIYYLDPDVYGDGVTSNNGHGHNIILNLYEAKIK